MIDYGLLKTFEDWSAVLEGLLDAGQDALVAGDGEKVVNIQRELRAFRLKSPNDICSELDNIARKAVRDLAVGQTQVALEALAERSNELTDHIKTISAVTSKADRAASIISLETPTSIVTSLSEVAGSLKKLKDSAKAKNLDAAKNELKAAVKAVEALRDKIQSL